MNTPGHDSKHAQMWILDIDGTLMPSHEIDNLCYWQAIDECIGGAAEPLELHGFKHVSDGGILGEWMDKTWHREATAAELERVRERFLELTQQAHAIDPSPFTLTPGMREWLEAIKPQGNQYIAVATGGWAHTARFKLQVAGLDRFNFPLASSDDAVDRAEIMQQALTLLKPGTAANDPVPAELPICYIGDGPWDFQASQSLGWDFIGIAQGARAQILREAGAKRVFCNFHELKASNNTPSTPRDFQGHALA